MRFWLSGALAIIFECSVFLAVFFAILPKIQKQYTFQDKTTVELIQIEEVVQKEETKQESPKTSKAVPNKSEKKQISSPKPSPKVGSNVKKLFEKIDSPNPPVREENIEDERPEFSANALKQQEYTFSKEALDLQKQSSKIQDALNALWDKELEVSPPQNMDITQGEYDEWFAKIKEILYAKWVNAFYESVTMTVSITIGVDGSFNYRVLRYSKNQSYNLYMEEMLNALKGEAFPPYPKGRITLEVTFKTKEHTGE